MVFHEKLKPLSWHIQGITNHKKWIRNEKICGCPKIIRESKNWKGKFLEHLEGNNQTIKYSLDIVPLPMEFKDNLQGLN
jgi:hypothetical protein